MCRVTPPLQVRDIYCPFSLGPETFLSAQEWSDPWGNRLGLEFGVWSPSHSHLPAQASMLDSPSAFGKTIRSPKVASILRQILQSKFYQTSASECWPLNPITRWGNLFSIWLAILDCVSYWLESQKAYPIVFHMNVLWEHNVLGNVPKTKCFRKWMVNEEM